MSIERTAYGPCVDLSYWDKQRRENVDLFKCDTILVNYAGKLIVSPTDKGEVHVFSDSQFFPAPDGSWVMVDYMESSDWYVCY